MNYEQSLDYLYSATPAFHLEGAKAYKPGLDNTHRLLAALGNPENKFKSVHIAGTNGKGSTSHLIAAVLQCAGLKVGLYTSPHLVDYRERIRINGQMIDKERVVAFVEKRKALIERVRPSFFEITMALAFDYFAQEQVDIAVVEVGLGGRLDSTNVITPLLSVITNIGLDHTAFLGNTLAEIAQEKAGIIKENVPVVIGESHPDTFSIFKEIAAQKGCKCVFADSQLPRPDYPCQLHGLYQTKNTQTAYIALRELANSRTLELLNFETMELAVRQGFAQVCTLTGLQGRWQEIEYQGNKYILDTGHNSHGLQYVFAQLHSQLSIVNCQFSILFGMVNDKDIDTVLHLMKNALSGLSYRLIMVTAQTHRAITAERLVELAEEVGLRAEAVPSLREAIEKTAQQGCRTSLTFIGGSNYVVGEALTIIMNDKS